jgi:hypothetical protein
VVEELLSLIEGVAGAGAISGSASLISRWRLPQSKFAYAALRSVPAGGYA